MNASGKIAIKDTRIHIEKHTTGIKSFNNSWDGYIKAYYRSVKAIDDAVGEILNELDKTGEADNTIVIYLSDQGHSNGEHGLTQKHYAYEDVMRIPFIIRYPKKYKKATKEELVLNIDIAPTILALCGTSANETLDGKSIVPTLDSENTITDFRDDFLFQFNADIPQLPKQLAVRTKEYKYIKYQKLDNDELYDLTKDPLEMKNVIFDPAYVKVKSEMQKRLINLIKKTGWKQRNTTVVPQGRIYVAPDEKATAEMKKQILDKTNKMLSKDWPTIKSAHGNFNFTPHIKNNGAAIPTVFLAFDLNDDDDHADFLRYLLSPEIPAKIYCNNEFMVEYAPPYHPGTNFSPILRKGKNEIIFELNDLPTSKSISFRLNR